MKIVFLTLLLAFTPERLALLEMMQADDALWENNVSRALAHLNKALEYDPENVDALYSLALLYMDQHRPEDAEPQLKLLVSLDPYQDDARLVLARAQWEQARSAEATETLGALFERQPGHVDGLELQEKVASGGPPGWLSRWKLRTSADLSAGYDGNVTLGSAASEMAAPVGSAQMGFGVSYDTRNRPFDIDAYVSLRQSLDNNADVNSVLPSEVGVSATGHLYLGWLETLLQASYRETFTDMFEEQYERSLRSQVVARWAFDRDHYLDVSAGFEHRRAYFEVTPETAGSFDSGVGDTWSWGWGTIGVQAFMGFGEGYLSGLSVPSGDLAEQALEDMGVEIPGADEANLPRGGLVADLRADNGANDDGVESVFLPVEITSGQYRELGGMAVIELNPMQGAYVYGMAQLIERNASVEVDVTLPNRDYALSLEWSETQVTAMVGASYDLPYDVALYTDYTYTQNASIDVRTYERHLWMLGVRYDYE